MSVGGSSLSSAALGQHNGVRKPKRAGREKRAAGNAGGGGKGVSASSAAGKGAGTGMRDTFLTQFHALGKLLYAKRGPPGEGAGDEEGRGPLTFVPEEVLSQGGMELDWALAFLQYHCVDFFTDESGEKNNKNVDIMRRRRRTWIRTSSRSRPRARPALVRYILCDSPILGH